MRELDLLGDKNDFSLVHHFKMVFRLPGIGRLFESRRNDNLKETF